MNRIFRGERMTISGRLKLNGELVSPNIYNVKMQIFEGNCVHASCEVTMTPPPQGSNDYTYEMDTTPYSGSLRFRFVVVKISDGSITVANNEITRMICE